MDLHITAILHESAISLAERPLRYLPGAMNFDDDPKAAAFRAEVRTFLEAHAPEGGISLQPYPKLRAWLARVEDLKGFVPMQASKAGLAA